MNRNSDFETRIKDILDTGAEQISPDIARRLQQARNRAVMKARKSPKPVWLPAAVAASVLLVLVSFQFWYGQVAQDIPDITLAMEVEMDLLISKDNLELIEDLEFFNWLAETEEYAG